MTRGCTGIQTQRRDEVRVDLLTLTLAKPNSDFRKIRGPKAIFEKNRKTYRKQAPSNIFS